MGNPLLLKFPVTWIQGHFYLIKLYRLWINTEIEVLVGDFISKQGQRIYGYFSVQCISLCLFFLPYLKGFSRYGDVFLET